MKLNQSGQQGKLEGKTVPATKDPVTITIDNIVKNDCNTLKSLIGDLTGAEENKRGLRRMFESKKCSFIETEYNYRIYRNLELNTGVELTQSNIEIKQNVANYIKVSDALGVALKNVVASAKDAKKKFVDLRKAAGDLQICLNDKCNCTQMVILTGKPPANSDEKNKKPGQPPACPDAVNLFRNLTNKPEYFLDDSDTVLTSAADISGITTFLNIKSIDQLQQEFSTYATAFDSQVQSKMNQGLAELTQLQKDLVKATTDLTTAEYALYNKRDEVDAERETIEYFCEGTCDCITYTNNNGEDMYEGRFDRCRKEICEICNKMDNHYCQHEPPQDNPQYS